MPRHRPKHAVQSAARVRLGRIARVAVPVAVVAGLAGGSALVWPDGAVSGSAVPAPAGASTAAPLSRDTADRVSRSDQRPALRPATPSAKSSTKSSSKASGKSSSKASVNSSNKASGKSSVKSSEPRRIPTAESAFTVTSVKSSVPGKRWAKIALNLRSAATDDARTPVDLDGGDAVSVTGWTSGEWAEVSVDGRKRWVKARYLLKSEPKNDAAKAEGSVSAAACSSSAAVESGLTSDAIRVHRAICHAFPDVKSYGGVRADSLPDHPSGRALDAMIGSSGEGQAIADYVRARASQLGVSEVIYAQRIWTVQRSAEGWRSMSDRGSATANHYDHVHVTVYGNAGG